MCFSTMSAVKKLTGRVKRKAFDWASNRMCGCDKKNGIAFTLKNLRKCSSSDELTKKRSENSGYLLKSMSCQPIPIAWSSLSRNDSGSMRNSGHTRAFDRNNKYAWCLVCFLTPWRTSKIEIWIFPVLPSMRLVIQKLDPNLFRLVGKLKRSSWLWSSWLPFGEKFSPIFLAISRRPLIRALSRLLFKIKNNTPKGAKMIKRKIRAESSSLVWNKSNGIASCYQLPRIGESEIGLRPTPTNDAGR